VKNMHKLMKQAQHMQSKIVKLQEEMADHQEEATAGGGMVTAVASGRGDLVDLKISPEVARAEEVEMLQDLVLVAVNEAIRKAREAVEEEMKKVTGGMGLPGMM
jgi:DNA-binding YbaB/EbfC family protein